MLPCGPPGTRYASALYSPPWPPEAGDTVLSRTAGLCCVAWGMQLQIWQSNQIRLPCAPSNPFGLMGCNLITDSDFWAYEMQRCLGQNL